MRWAVAATLSVLAAGCRLSFGCLDDDGCTLREGGVCQAIGRCSYPDADCASGQRYSEHAGELSNDCVDEGSTTGSTGETSATTASTDESTTSPDPCAGVDCSGNGTCAVVDGEAACECDDGFEPMGLQCVEALCPGECVYVDIRIGEDTNPGTEVEPIKTLARAAELASGLAPGDAILLRRGQTWAEPWNLTGIAGTPDNPVAIKPYGPAEELGPEVEGQLAIADLTGLIVSGLTVSNPSASAVRIVRSSHVTFLSGTVMSGGGGCIVVEDASEFIAIVDNAVANCGNARGISIGFGSSTGAHHYVLDNRVDAAGAISAIHVQAGVDVKVIGNYLHASIDRGLHSRVSDHGWLIGNVLAAVGDNNDAGIDHAGAGEVVIQGNVLIDVEWPAQLSGSGRFVNNTIVHDGSVSAVSLSATVSFALTDNIIASVNGPWVSANGAAGLVLDRNAYGEQSASACMFQQGMLFDFPAWQGLGFDPNSQCAMIPGLAIPANIGPVETWDAANLLQDATPDAGWDGCDLSTGALDCDGTPRAPGIPKFADLALNAGHGWLGPPEVQARVTFVD